MKRLSRLQVLAACEQRDTVGCASGPDFDVTSPHRACTLLAKMRMSTRATKTQRYEDEECG